MVLCALPRRLEGLVGVDQRIVGQEGIASHPDLRAELHDLLRSVGKRRPRRIHPGGAHRVAEGEVGGGIGVAAAVEIAEDIGQLPGVVGGEAAVISGKQILPAAAEAVHPAKTAER